MAFLLWSSVALFLLRLWLSLYGGIHPDEAYYWTWTQNLRLGYYDHPPMVAYIIWLGQKTFELIFGTNYADSKTALILSSRWLASALGYICFPMLIGASVQNFQRRSLTMSQVFAILSSPLIVFGAQIITPDLPLVLVWSASFLLSLKIRQKLRRGLKPGMLTPFSWNLSLWMGLLWALGAYSKYTAVFLPLLFVLSGAGFWNTFVAGLICGSLLSPYLYWTFTDALSQNMGIFYQLNRGTKVLGTEIHLNWVGDLWIAQFLFWSPAFVVDYFIDLSRNKRLSWSLSAWIFLPLLFFSVTGLRNFPEANWPVMGGIALMVYVIAQHIGHPIRLFWYAGLNYACIILALWGLLNQSTVGKLLAPFKPELGAKLQARVSRIEEFRGWDNLRRLLFESTLSDNLPIHVEKYHVLSPLLFFDRAARSDERLGSRLKIDYVPGKSVSQFHFEKEFLPPETEIFWLLRKGEAAPDGKKCEIRQTFIKADPKGEAFSLFKCKRLIQD